MVICAYLYRSPLVVFALDRSTLRKGFRELRRTRQPHGTTNSFYTQCMAMLQGWAIQRIYLYLPVSEKRRENACFLNVQSFVVWEYFGRTCPGLR